MIKKVLLAYDGSENADAALDFFLDMNSSLKAKVVVLHIIDESVLFSYGVNIPEQIYEDIRKHGEEIVKKAVNKFKSVGNEAEGVILEGSPGDRIIEYSTKIKVDMIVTGSRGLSGFKSALLGSVSAKLVHECKLPILVIKKSTTPS